MKHTFTIVMDAHRNLDPAAVREVGAMFTNFGSELARTHPPLAGAKVSSVYVEHEAETPAPGLELEPGVTVEPDIAVEPAAVLPEAAEVRVSIATVHGAQVMTIVRNGTDGRFQLLELPPADAASN